MRESDATDYGYPKLGNYKLSTCRIDLWIRARRRVLCIFGIFLGIRYSDGIGIFEYSVYSFHP